MAISDKHPLYSHRIVDWVAVRDAYEGERQIKSKRTTYLPATSGQIIDGMTTIESIGYKAYESYLTRARYPGHVESAVQTAIGMMHHNPAKINLPKQLEYMFEKATLKNEDLFQLLRRINEQQLVTGRIGLLLDLPFNPSIGKDFPYIATYNAEDIINWDFNETLHLVVLNESSFERKVFEWEQIEKYRVLSLGTMKNDETNVEYKFGIFSKNTTLEFSEALLNSPSYRGKTLNKIPFVFINSCDLLSDPDKPVLMDLVNLCLTIYRGEADYRQNLFMQGQDTLVIVGGMADDEAIRTGAGSNIFIPIGGDAKYIGVESSGLAEQREALDNDNRKAGSMGAQTLDTISRERESGKSLQTRVSARTASLNQIATAGAKGLENILKIAAEWVGADPSEVSIIPNYDFGDTGISGQEITYLQNAKNTGAPLSAESIHALLVEKRITVKSYEDELAALTKEKGSILDKPPTA